MKREMYNVNPTMELLEHQKVVSMLDDEMFAELQNIMKAYEEFGSGWEKVLAISFRKYNECFLSFDIFMLGYIYGKREERKKNKK